MVDARDDGAAAPIIFDQLELPQRPRMIQRRGSEFADMGFELGLAGPGGQLGHAHMPVEVEFRVGFPESRGTVVDRLLAKARIGQEALGDRAS